MECLPSAEQTGSERELKNAMQTPNAEWSCRNGAAQFSGVPAVFCGTGRDGSYRSIEQKLTFDPEYRASKGKVGLIITPKGDGDPPTHLLASLVVSATAAIYFCKCSHYLCNKCLPFIPVGKKKTVELGAVPPQLLMLRGLLYSNIQHGHPLPPSLCSCFP